MPAAGRKPGLLGQVQAETGQSLGADLETVTGSGDCRLCLLMAKAVIKHVLCPRLCA